MRKLGVLSSSRADYGIYQPLLELISRDTEIELHIICFGMHSLKSQGRTIDLVKQDAYGEVHEVEGMLEADSASGIVSSYAALIQSFAGFWEKNSFDLILALGDRFEMSAAVQSLIPFEIEVAHIHAGETTEGAIDDVYRHQITLAAKYHFTCTDTYSERVREILPKAQHVHNVGSLSLSGIHNSPLKDWSFVRTEFDIPDSDYVLVTFHPETVESDKNSMYVSTLAQFFEKYADNLHFIVTLPNADTNNGLYRNLFFDLKQAHPSSFSLVDTFGRANYYSAMKNSLFLLGNTSSGIIEAASMNKYVINVGDRQKGRARSENMRDVSYDLNEMSIAVEEVRSLGDYNGTNIYYQKNSAEKTLEIIKSLR